jgi:large subunit ribosomal protein L24
MKTLLRKNDVVICTGGKSRGKQGKLLSINRAKGRAIVEGLQMIKRHTKKSQANPQGAIVEKEGTIALPNHMMFCPTCQKGVRLGIKLEGDKKIRVCRKCKNAFDK